MADIVVAVDQGTTNTKALAVDASGTVVASASAPVTVRYPRPSWVEQDADELWESTRAVLAACLSQLPANTIVGIALSAQRESVVAWNRRDGRPVGPVLSWQDARTSDRCLELQADSRAKLVPVRTGLALDPMFSATKMSWLAEHTETDDLALGTVESWLLWNLVGEHLAEAGNASRTLLLDIERLSWDEDLADLFGVPAQALGRVVRSDGPLGLVSAEGLPRVPVLAVLADSHAALLAHTATDPSTVKATYGTGSSVMRSWPTHSPVDSGVSTTLAWLTTEPAYALEGNIRYSGAALDWTAHLLGVADGAELGRLAAKAPDAGGVVLVPAFGGLGAPHWDRDAVGVLTNLSAGSTREHIARAAFDAVAMQVADVVDAMSPESTDPPATLHADGGASISALLMQRQADVLGTEVVTSATAELSAMGAARMAGNVLGWPRPAPVTTPGARYRPTSTDAERLRDRAAWADALTRARATPSVAAEASSTRPDR
jgi:glycerol kinase